MAPLASGSAPSAHSAPSVPPGPAPGRNTRDDWAGPRGSQWRAHLAPMEAMLAPIDEPLVAALPLAAACRIADLGCGGGATTRSLARRAPPGTIVHGFDVSPELIHAATAGGGSDECSVAFEVADLATAPAPALPYDALVSRFGVMFFADPAAAFANLLGWLAPGGRFAFAVWGRPIDNPWILSVREAAAEVFALPPTEPDAPGPFRYGAPGPLVELLARAGFASLEVRTWRGELAVGGGMPAALAAQFALSAFTVSEQFAAGDAALRARVRQGLIARFARHEVGRVVRLGACVHIVTGARPGPRRLAARAPARRGGAQ